MSDEKLPGEELMEEYCKIVLKDYLSELKELLPQKYVGADIDYVTTMIEQHVDMICAIGSVRAATFTRLLLRALVGNFADNKILDEIDDKFVEFVEVSLIPRADVEPGYLKSKVDELRKRRQAYEDALLTQAFTLGSPVGRA